MDVWSLDFGCMDVEFWLHGCWILVGWILNFGWLDDGFWSYRCLILVDGCWI